MARARSSVVETRRKPHQARAVVTVATVFAATARIIERQGRRPAMTRVLPRGGLKHLFPRASLTPTGSDPVIYRGTWAG